MEKLNDEELNTIKAYLKDPCNEKLRDETNKIRMTRFIATISDLENKIVENFQPSIEHLKEFFYFGGDVYNIIYQIQSWQISGGKAMELFRNLLFGRKIKYPIKSDMDCIYNTDDWQTQLVDEIPQDWPAEGRTYNIAGVKSGDRILLLRKK